MANYREKLDDFIKGGGGDKSASLSLKAYADQSGVGYFDVIASGRGNETTLSSIKIPRGARAERKEGFRSRALAILFEARRDLRELRYKVKVDKNLIKEARKNGVPTYFQ